MEYYVYIIQSLIDSTLYKGFTKDYSRRLVQHNNGESHYTSGKIPWKIVYVERFPDKTSALIREKRLKKANSKYLQWLINESELNILR